MDKMKFKVVLWHRYFTEKKNYNFFPLKTMHFFFRERSEQQFAQLFKFYSSSSFRKIFQLIKKRIPYYVALGEKIIII